MYAAKDFQKKFVRELYGDEFMMLSSAEEQKWITIQFSDIHADPSSLDKMIKSFQQDLFSSKQSVRTASQTFVQQCDELRAYCITNAITKLILPSLEEELRLILLSEASENIVAACGLKSSNLIRKNLGETLPSH